MFFKYFMVSIFEKYETIIKPSLKYKSFCCFLDFFLQVYNHLVNYYLMLT